MEEKKLTAEERRNVIMEYLKAHDNGEDGYIGDEIAAAVGLQPTGINSTLNSLVKKGLLEKVPEGREREFVNKAGEKVMNKYTTYHLTDAGRAYQA